MRFYTYRTVYMYIYIVYTLLRRRRLIYTRGQLYSYIFTQNRNKEKPKMCATDLDSGFGQLRLAGQPFARSHARVMRLFEFLFQFAQLARIESGAIASEFALLVVVKSRRVAMLIRQLVGRKRSAASRMGRRRWCHAVCPNGRVFRAGFSRVLTQRAATSTSAETAATTGAHAAAATAAYSTVGRI